MLNSTHTFVSPTPTTLEGYLLEFKSSMSLSFVSEYSRKFFSGEKNSSCFGDIARVRKHRKTGGLRNRIMAILTFLFPADCLISCIYFLS